MLSWRLPGRNTRKTARSLTIDSDNQLLTIVNAGETRDIPLYSKEAFERLSREWVRIGWSLRYYHTFTWFGLPILQLPEDLVRLQEVVVAVQPDVIIETGVFDGGSLLFHATLCETLGKGRVIGIDITIRETARAALSRHHLGSRIHLEEGSSVSPETVAAVHAKIRPGEKVMVILDSDHSRQHVAAELEAYAPFVTPGSCMIATDGIMRDLCDVPGGEPSWEQDNPAAAARQFAEHHPEFELRQPPWLTNMSTLEHNITYWPDAWLWRK